MIKDYDFHCPHCDADLKQNNCIVLMTERTNGDFGEIRLATTVGNYKYEHVPEVEFGPGEMVDFLCRYCNSKLNSDKFQNYALLRMKVEDTIEFDILFSRQAGIQKTYLITEDGIETYSGNG